MSIGPNQSLSNHAIPGRRQDFSADEILAEIDRRVDKGRLHHSDPEPDRLV